MLGKFITTSENARGGIKGWNAGFTGIWVGSSGSGGFFTLGSEFTGGLLSLVSKSDDFTDFLLAGANVWVVLINLLLDGGILTELLGDVIDSGEEVPGVSSEVIDGTFR